MDRVLQQKIKPAKLSVSFCRPVYKQSVESVSSLDKAKDITLKSHITSEHGDTTTELNSDIA